jgi:hypothetical protein
VVLVLLQVMVGDWVLLPGPGGKGLTHVTVVVVVQLLVLVRRGLVMVVVLLQLLVQGGGQMLLLVGIWLRPLILALVLLFMCGTLTTRSTKIFINMII